MSDSAVVEGVGLHSGEPCRVVLRSLVGPVRLRARGVEALLGDLTVVSTERATTVEAPGAAWRIGTVEHAFAALAGLGIYEGLLLDVEGPEMPLLDGGASRWCDALSDLALPASAPRLRVLRVATYDIGPSRYDFAPADDDAPHITAVIAFDDLRLVPEATWDGDSDDFVSRIAPARTFAFAREVEEIARRGLARHIDPASVVVVAPEGLLHAGRAATADEPARHKLLDLLGDLYLHGGPTIGHVRGLRPGHAANDRAFRRARAEGVIG